MSSTVLLTRGTPRISHRVLSSKFGTTKTPSRGMSQTTNLPGSTTTSQAPPSSHSQDIPSPSPPFFNEVFATPTWSVRSLLHPNSFPSSSSASSSSSLDTTITPATLHHLLRLSALPPPSTPAEEAALLHTLQTQLHFVRAIQAVDTTGVAPLATIRDETSAAATVVTLETLKGVLAAETVVGTRKRPRRPREVESERSEEEVMVEQKTRERRAKGYYVVESGKVNGGE